MERFEYRAASRISVIAERFPAESARERRAGREDHGHPGLGRSRHRATAAQRRTAFASALGLSDELVVMYAGNLGLTSCLEDVSRAAEPREGGGRHPLCDRRRRGQEGRSGGMAQERHSAMLLFLPYQPREVFPRDAGSSRCGPRDPQPWLRHSSLPSKIFNVMASARPVLAVAPLDSEIAHLVEDCALRALSCRPERPELLADGMLRPRRAADELAEMGRNGRISARRTRSRVGAAWSSTRKCCRRSAGEGSSHHER